MFTSKSAMKSSELCQAALTHGKSHAHLVLFWVRAPISSHRLTTAKALLSHALDLHLCLLERMTRSDAHCEMHLDVLGTRNNMKFGQLPVPPD